ncbi:MAG TPA: hypothetical protein VGH23_08640 [Rhizomicrobium sp.]
MGNTNPVATTWVVRTLPLRTPSHSLAFVLAGDANKNGTLHDGAARLSGALRMMSLTARGLYQAHENVPSAGEKIWNASASPIAENYR